MEWGGCSFIWFRILKDLWTTKRLLWWPVGTGPEGPHQEMTSSGWERDAGGLDQGGDNRGGEMPTH